jgi:hypothetical protein
MISMLCVKDQLREQNNPSFNMSVCCLLGQAIGCFYYKELHSIVQKHVPTMALWSMPVFKMKECLS